MKITKEQLKQIIKEELEAVQTEQSVKENYGDERYKSHEKECSELIQQALDEGHISSEEAWSEFGRCMDERRMGGV